MCLSGYIFWFVNDTRLSILMDDLNDFSGLISSKPTKTLKLKWPPLIMNTLKYFTQNSLYVFDNVKSNETYLFVLWRTIINFNIRLKCSYNRRIKIATYISVALVCFQ